MPFSESGLLASSVDSIVKGWQTDLNALLVLKEETKSQT